MASLPVNAGGGVLVAARLALGRVEGRESVVTGTLAGEGGSGGEQKRDTRSVWCFVTFKYLCS